LHTMGPLYSPIDFVCYANIILHLVWSQIYHLVVFGVFL
jgi:hypothetical protein